MDPNTILHAENPYHFAAKRFTEMSRLVSVLKAPKPAKLAFQTLPKHMRRRAATLNPKRLPRRLRATHKSQFKKSGTPIRTKRPTRKYRRKPINLRKEYDRRSSAGKPGWLETHLWHAKRFHMVTRWGYRLPWAPCDKGYRACYRASSKYCLMNDISYMNTLQLSGPLETLKEGFKKITSSSCGPTLNAKYLLDGKREGHTYIFSANKYPLGCLGRVSFFWLPKEPANNQSRIWLSVHPAIVNAVQEELIAVFELNKESNNLATGNQVELRNLRGKINRFRLTGPLAHIVISSALKCKTTTSANAPGMNQYLKDTEQVQVAQQEFWMNCQRLATANQLPSSMVLPLSVEDPRLNRRSSKSPVNEQFAERDSNNYVTEIPDCLNESPIFSSDLLESVSKNVMTPSAYSKARNAETVVPGQKCKFEDAMQTCPVILIQRPGDGNSRLGFNSGWDVILPYGYGSLLWINLVMWGARVGGLREEWNTLLEAKQDLFQPDTGAGAIEAKTTSDTSRATYFRRPCNKRPNFIKLSVASPFLSPFRQLLREWNGQPENLNVIRDRFVLEDIEKRLAGKSKDLPSEFLYSESALVPITFKMIGRGILGPNSLICIPDAADDLRSKEPVHQEPLKKDIHEVARKKCRALHLRLLAKMRRKRLKVKRQLQLRSTKKVTISKPLSEQLIAEQHKRMCELWLPSTFPSIRRQCSRETIGYSSAADFSYVEGRSSGTGYVTFAGLKDLLKKYPKSPATVLMRDPKSREYRNATISVMF